MLRGDDASAFHINDVTGEIQTKWSLDREEKALYQFTVHCHDMGQDVQLSGTTNVKIKVKDENDNRPVFTNLMPKLNVPNTIKAGNHFH